MNKKSSAEMNFDAWSELARNDPAAFETMRLAAIEAVIEGAPEANRDRLRRLQWRIDQERRLARTPMGACIRISRMMWRSLLGPGGLHDRFAELQQVVSGRPAPTVDATRPAGQVIAMARGGD